MLLSEKISLSVHSAKSVCPPPNTESQYVRYRNEVRGHYALAGKPATTRLAEQHFYALPSVLADLEKYVRHELKSQKADLCHCVRVLGRNAYLPDMRTGDVVRLFEVMNGLEAQAADGRIFLLRDFQLSRRMFNNYAQKDELPPSFRFEPLNFSLVTLRSKRSKAKAKTFATPI